MKVALVYPEVYDLARYKEKRKEFPPFGVLYLGAFLEENNIEVSVFKISKDNIQYDFTGYKIIGFSIPSSATYNIVRESRFGSLYSSNSVIVIGGVHPSFYPEQTLVDFQANVVVVGNGEKTILEIVHACSINDFSKISGVCFLDGYSIVKTPERAIEKSIDWLPLPARHLLNESDFIMNNRLADTDTRMTHIMLSRGCPFSCNFCAILQKKVQYRSGASARMELEHLKRRYFIEGFAIVDDNFVINKNAVKSVCNSISNLGLRWSALSRVDTVDYELLEVMRNAGCIELKFGVESGSERILRSMGKNVSCNQIRQAITLAYSEGIKVKIFLIHGFPGENLASTRDTISLLKDIAHMVDRVSLFRFVPLPGSYAFKNPKVFDLHIPEHIKDWDKFHIYHNDYHWWGSVEDFRQVEIAYRELEKFIADNWK